MIKNLKKHIAIAAACIFASSNLVAYAGDGYFSGGAGTAEDPYLISTADDLVQLSTLSNTADTTASVSNKYYKLTADIDMTGKVYDGLGTKAVENNWAGQFEGTIDGDYHVISNLVISNETGKTNVSTDFARGFIAFSSGATVKNLGIDTITVTTAGRAGGIAAFVSGNTTIENCFVRNATINGNTSGGVGGLIGYAQSGKNIVVEDCYTIGNAGLFGQNESKATTTMKRVYCGNDKGQFSNLPNVCEYAYRFSNATTPSTCWHNGTYTSVGITLSEAMTNLGAAFAEDKLAQNGGYPVLAWENEKTSENGTIVIKNFNAVKTEENSVIGEYLIKNYNTAAKSVNIAVILYGANNEMLAANVYDAQELASGQSSSLDFTFNDKPDAKSVNMFLWDSLSTLNETDYIRTVLSTAGDSE